MNLRVNMRDSIILTKRQLEANLKSQNFETVAFFNQSSTKSGTRSNF